MSEKTCENCFFCELVDVPNIPNAGLCKRLPPVTHLTFIPNHQMNINAMPGNNNKLVNIPMKAQIQIQTMFPQITTDIKACGEWGPVTEE